MLGVKLLADAAAAAGAGAGAHARVGARAGTGVRAGAGAGAGDGDGSSDRDDAAAGGTPSDTRGADRAFGWPRPPSSRTTASICWMNAPSVSTASEWKLKYSLAPRMRPSHLLDITHASSES